MNNIYETTFSCMYTRLWLYVYWVWLHHVKLKIKSLVAVNQLKPHFMNNSPHSSTANQFIIQMWQSVVVCAEMYLLTSQGNTYTDAREMLQSNRLLLFWLLRLIVCLQLLYFLSRMSKPNHYITQFTRPFSVTCGGLGLAMWNYCTQQLTYKRHLAFKLQPMSLFHVMCESLISYYVTFFFKVLPPGFRVLLVVLVFVILAVM